MKRLLLSLFMVLASGLVFAQPYADRFFTMPVSHEDGDSVRTRQVSVSSSVATVILPAVTDRSNRVRTIHNSGSFTVYIGTQAAGTTLTTLGFDVTPSTGNASVYRTNSTSAVYGLSGANSADTVTVIEEFNSIP